MWNRLKQLGNHQVSSNNANNNQSKKKETIVISGELPTFILICEVELPVTIWFATINDKTNTINQSQSSIDSYLTPRDKRVLSQTSKSFYLLDKDEFAKQRKCINTLFQITDKPYNNEELHKLLSHAALGEWKQAEKIWSKDPSLLTRCGTVYHPNRIYDEKGNVIEEITSWKNLGYYKFVGSTAWQVAMMHSEFEEAEKMGEKMTFDEKQRQFFEIFPDGKIEKYNNKFEIAKKLIDAAFAAIIADNTIDENNLEKMNDETRKALQELYYFLTPPPEHKMGLVFDVNIYIYALEKYDNNLDKFTKSNEWDQRSLWCIRVEEVIASVLGTGYLRVHAQGPGNVEDNNNNIKPELINRDGCKLKDGSSYFPFRRPLNSIPGGHIFVGYYGAGELRTCARARWRTTATFFQNFYQTKTKSGTELCSSIHTKQYRF